MVDKSFVVDTSCKMDKSFLDDKSVNGDKSFMLVKSYVVDKSFTVDKSFMMDRSCKVGKSFMVDTSFTVDKSLMVDKSLKVDTSFVVEIFVCCLFVGECPIFSVGRGGLVVRRGSFVELVIESIKFVFLFCPFERVFCLPFIFLFRPSVLPEGCGLEFIVTPDSCSSDGGIRMLSI